MNEMDGFNSSLNEQRGQYGQYGQRVGERWKRNDKQNYFTEYGRSNSKYHSPNPNTNPLEVVGFTVAEKMIESPRVRLIVSLYIVIVHVVLVMLALIQRYWC